MKNALILYPNQLFPVEQLPEVHTVVVLEEPLFFGMHPDQPLKLNKQKLVLHRASMRRYVEEVLWPAKYDVDYVELDVFMNSSDVLGRVKQFDKVYIFDPVDERLTEALLAARRERAEGPPVEFLPSPNFYLKEPEVREFMGGHHKSFADFYQWQRERFNVLIGGDYKPLGGKWMLDGEKSAKLPEGQALPSFAAFGDNKHVARAVEWANEHFPDNPGSTDFIWPTDHAESSAWLSDFVENRLDYFATYQNNLDASAPWLFHSVLSANLNIGLLSPHQVVEAALGRHARKPVDLPSLEAFVRLVLGRREYTRGSYVLHAGAMRGSDPFKGQRRMSPAWYEGTLGIPPFDNLVRKLQAHGYAHQSERLLIAGNLMVLAEINLEDIRSWFSQLFIDSYEWSMLPNVHSLVNLRDPDGTTAASPSSVVLGLGDYQRGQWSDIWDGLYWRFIDRHKELLKQNKNTRAAVQRLGRLDADRRRIINYRAEDFLNNFTN
jgi:deoxyribodipyrimidine photolyase-related protein